MDDILYSSNLEPLTLKKSSVKNKHSRTPKTQVFWHLTPKALGLILISKQTVLGRRKVEYLYSLKDRMAVCLACRKTFNPEHTPPLIFPPEVIKEGNLHVAASFCQMCIMFAQFDECWAQLLIKTVNRYRMIPKEPFTDQHLRFVK